MRIKIVLLTALLFFMFSEAFSPKGYSKTYDAGRIVFVDTSGTAKAIGFDANGNLKVVLTESSGVSASDTSAWTYEDTTLTLTTAATQLSVLLTRTKLIGDIVIQNAPASTVNIVGGWTSAASLVVFPSGSLHYDFLGNPKRFYLKSESGTPSVNISYKYKP